MKRMFCLIVSLSAACSSGDPAASPPPSRPAVGIDEIGKTCTTGCGSGDARKCAAADAQGGCTSGLCVADLSQPLEKTFYCSSDCSQTPCPALFHCEDVVVPSEGARRICVADSNQCGDGIKQYGEACDGSSLAGRCEASCLALQAATIDVGVTLTYVNTDPPERIVHRKTQKNIAGDLPVPQNESKCDGASIQTSTKDGSKLELTLCYKRAKAGVATIVVSLPRDMASRSSPGTLTYADEGASEPDVYTDGVVGTKKITLQQDVVTGTMLFRWVPNANQTFEVEITGSWRLPPPL